MSRTQEIIMDKLPESLTETSGAYNIMFRILKYGIVAGGLMVIYLLALQVTENDHSLGLKFLKYLILAAILGITLNDAKDYFPPVTFFKRGIQIGAGISFISALMIMISNLFLFFIEPALTFNKFNLEAGNLGQLLVLNITILFEIFVFGMIITFILLQSLKYQDPKNETLF